MFQAPHADVVERLSDATAPLGAAVRRADGDERIPRIPRTKTYFEGWHYA